MGFAVPFPIALHICYHVPFGERSLWALSGLLGQRRPGRLGRTVLICPCSPCSETPSSARATSSAGSIHPLAPCAVRSEPRSPFSNLGWHAGIYRQHHAFVLILAKWRVQLGLLASVCKILTSPAHQWLSLSSWLCHRPARGPSPSPLLRRALTGTGVGGGCRFSTAAKPLALVAAPLSVAFAVPCSAATCPHRVTWEQAVARAELRSFTGEGWPVCSCEMRADCGGG